MPHGSDSVRSSFTHSLERFLTTTVCRWPASARSLVVILPLAAAGAAAWLLVLASRVMAAQPWAIDGIIAITACLALAYVFGRGADA